MHLPTPAFNSDLITKFALAQNAVAHIQDRTYLRGGGGITALEAYHAGAVRTLLAQQANLIVQPFGVSVASICQVRRQPLLKRECMVLHHNDHDMGA